MFEDSLCRVLLQKKGEFWVKTCKRETRLIGIVFVLSLVVALGLFCLALTYPNAWTVLLGFLGVALIAVSPKNDGGAGSAH